MKKISKSTIILLLILITIIIGYIRIYYGGGIVIRIVAKDSFSFKDTIVNLDDIFGMPRIAVAINHPAVKRQLEKMKIIKTDKQIEENIKQELELETMKEYEKLRKQFGF